MLHRFILLSAVFLMNVKLFAQEAQWSGAEHLDLGQQAYAKTCKTQNLPCIKVIKRADGTDFNYGQILAMGDFYLTVEEAFEDNITNFGLKRIFKCIDKQGKVHEEQIHHPDVDYPDCDWVIITGKLDYLKVVSNNYDHFVWDNIMAYIKYHQIAIDHALQSFAYKEMQMNDIALEYLNKALFINAFADHFLTDSFPAGHIRVPRKEITIWAKQKLKGPLKKLRSDALAALLHNSEGVDIYSKKSEGLKVENSRGDIWITEKDAHLHTNLLKNPLKKSLIIDAVCESISEVLMAAQGLQPMGIFKATTYVPIPVSKISQKYNFETHSAYSVAKKLKSFLPIPLRVITRTTDVKSLLYSIENITNLMKKRIKKEVDENPIIRQRVAENYINYFLEN